MENEHSEIVSLLLERLYEKDLISKEAYESTMGKLSHAEPQM